MGQRNATYVIVKCGNHESILPIYNQWNYIKIQAAKMVRGIKKVKEFNWEFGYPSIIPYLYFSAAGENRFSEKGIEKAQWVGGNIETELYREGDYAGAFQEDNNNGWNIIQFTVKNNGEVSTDIFCKVGSEDEERASSKSLSKYFFETMNKADLKYLRDNCKWNPYLEATAERLLSNLCPQIN